MIKISIAKERNTHKLVNAKDVPNGLECNCYCDKCKENLVAVNREIKQKAHFRHTPNSECEFNKNYESYIHWLSKELIKDLDSICLPQIRSMDLMSNSGAILEQRIFTFLDQNGLEDLRNNFFNDEQNIFYHRTILLQEPSKIKIDKCLIEKEEKSKLGKIRVDIILLCQNQKLFIEPFFTHQIDEEKRAKVRALNVSTLSINLRSFILGNEYLFTIEEFKYFLIHDLESKKWQYIRDSKVERLILNLLSNIWPKSIQEIKEVLKQNDLIASTIADNNMKIKNLSNENLELVKQLEVINLNNLFEKKVRQ